MRPRHDRKPTMDERIAAAMVPGGTTVAADPYPWPFDGNLTPDNTALIVIDMQVDFCAPGGYVDSMGYDIVADARADRAHPAGARRHARQGLPRSSTRARATSPTSPTCRPTSAGARSGSAPASATRARAAASWCAANRAGRSFPSFSRSPARRSSTSPARARSCATDLELVLKNAGIRNIVLDRRHHRRLRPHHHARRQRPRLRVPAALRIAARRPTSATTWRR